MTGAGSDACTVTLTAAGGSGGLSVALASSNAAVTVPATVVVPANRDAVQDSRRLCSSVTTAQAVTPDGECWSALPRALHLQLNAAVPTLTVSPTSLAFGNVAVNTASTQPVTLTSTGTSPVTIDSATLSGAGYTLSGAAFPVTLNPTQSVTLNVQFDPATAGAATGQVTIQSTSSTNGTAVISLTGTGTAVPAALSALSCSSASMTGSGSGYACTVTLTSAAGSGGLSVGLTSSNAGVTVPAHGGGSCQCEPAQGSRRLFHPLRPRKRRP